MRGRTSSVASVIAPRHEQANSSATKGWAHQQESAFLERRTSRRHRRETRERLQEETQGEEEAHMTGYWESRKNFGYYVLVKAWLEAIAPYPGTGEQSILDVGCLDTPTATWAAFSKRYTIDLVHDPKLPAVQSFVDDFLTWQPPHRMSVVTCLQVLEHLTDDIVHEFGAKLRAISDYTIVSVPFMWKAGEEPDHKQDPVDLLKLSRFMGEFPNEYAIVFDTRRLRLVARWNNLP
jgi:hypothetical protein